MQFQPSIKHFTQNLSYPSAENLCRTEKGIKAQCEPSAENFIGNFYGLLNYPIEVVISRTALEKINRSVYGSSLIEIKVHSKLGKTVPLFAINSNFFERVKRSQNSNTGPFKAVVKPFHFNPLKRTFEEEASSERSFLEKPLNNNELFLNKDVITHFSARYLTGELSLAVPYSSIFTIESIQPFSLSFLSAYEFPEKLVLRIDTTSYYKLQLKLEQRESECFQMGKQYRETLSNQIGIIKFAKKNLIISSIPINTKQSEPSPKIPDSLLCPITQEMMKDPVIDNEGNSYEREAILEWLKRQKTSPLTRQPLKFEHLVPNRALKEIIQAYPRN